MTELPSGKVDPEIVLGRLVAACIDARDHPVIEERDQALGDLTLVLEDIVRKRLAGVWEWDPRYFTLDGTKPLSVTADGEARLHLLGAFYLLGDRGHRMLPVDAALTIEPGEASIVKVASAQSVFDLPQSERQFIRGVEAAAWRHELRLELGI